MEELLRLINKTKEENPVLSTDMDAILEDVRNSVAQGKDEDMEVSFAMSLIDDLVKQLEEWS